jgi:hypothetical protein
VVIDTGLRSHIFDAIKTFDSTQEHFYFVGSSGKYPQLEEHMLQAEAIKYAHIIERFPRLTGRTSTYTERGGGVSKHTLTDDQDIPNSEITPLQIQQMNKALLRAMHLGPWFEMQYQRYTGLRPEERLRLNTRAEVEQHYKDIADLRSK